MRRTRLAGATITAVTLLGVTGCGSGFAVKAGTLASADGVTGGAGGSGGSGGADVYDTAVCAQVRAGIDAFNQGDYEATVQHFTRAVPLAHARVVADDTRVNEELLEAVVYYAELAPLAYASAASSSPDFQRYKAVTLGLCASGESGAGQQPSAPGLQT